ncbi:uncharacterized protein LOC130136747 [Syzygium oleosum]|uniref:uncharacterized protein LOC130136747 n=1 Tax=Syzygium oleosum TaxID=219896 RepID=UPI0024B8FBD4|nr:uncharacterized protein LOC130136747 [Syzygium oleosum]
MHKDQLLLLLLLLLPRSFSIAIENNQCTTSCGEVANISFPFRLKGDPTVCGDPNYELACINNRTVLDLYSGKYYVRSIDYTNYTIWVADVGLQKGDCSSLPLRSLSCHSFWLHPNSYECGDYTFYGRELSKTVSIVNCSKAVASQFYIDTLSCLDGVKFSNFSSTRRRLYAMVDANVSYVETACTIELMAMIPGWVDGDDLRSYAQIHEQMVYGFELSWLPIVAEMHCKHRYWDIIGKHQIRCGPKSKNF